MPETEILLTKRKEYSNEIISLTRERFASVCKELYDRACKKNRVSRFILRDFQFELKNVASWSSDDLDHVLKRFVDVQGLPRLLFNMHVVNYKIFSEGSKCVLPAIPKPNEYPIRDFIYSVSLAMARELWRKPYLLYDKIENEQLMENKKELEKLVKDSIKQGLGKLVSLQQCEEVIEELSENESDDFDTSSETDPSDSEEESEPESESEPDSDSESVPELEQPKPIPEESDSEESYTPPARLKSELSHPDFDSDIELEPPVKHAEPEEPTKQKEIDDIDTLIDKDEFMLDDCSDISKVKRRRSSIKPLAHAKLATYKTYYNSQMNDNLKYFVNRKKLADQHRFF